MSEHTSPSTRISDHYEVAPVKELVTPILDTHPESHDQPPAIPPKAQPPPIPPKSVHKDSDIRYSIQYWIHVAIMMNIHVHVNGI